MVATPSTILLCLGVLAVLVPVLTIALASPPNNWDSMTYHLPRVMHWAADHDVRFYPTSIDRQLYSAPLAEYVILHVYLLTGSDFLFNSVQCGALAGCAVMASLIARQLGGARRAQALAALLAVTVPMGILQASSTQNDLVEAFLLLLVANAALEFRTVSRSVFAASWPLAASVALALLAKSTGYLLAGPFVVLGLSVRWRSWRSWRSWRLLVAPLALMLVFIVTVNMGQALRNEKAYGSLIGPPDSHVLVNSHFSPAVTTVSALRLLGSAATTSHTWWNTHLLGLVDRGSKLVGVKTPDPGTLYGATTYSVGWSIQEDSASYPIDTIAICLVLLLTLLRAPPLRGLRAGYVGAGLAGFLIFASYLRWQPWINRLDMPLAMLLLPVVAVTIAAWHRFLVVPAALAFAWLAPVFVLHNSVRPLAGAPNVLSIPNHTMLFWSRGSDSAPYDMATQIIKSRHARTVGLIEGVDDWEYPLWRLNGGALGGVRFVDIRAADLAGKPAPRFDVAICTDPIVASCTALTKPGWVVSPLGAGMVIATPAS